MKKLLPLLALLLCAPLARAQNPPTELACPSGSMPLAGIGQTFNPSTSKFRQWLCVDPNGVVNINSATLSASSFGAVEDNTTDNCTAFTSLAKAVNASTSKEVYVVFPHNQNGIAYLLSCTIDFTHPVIVIGNSVINVSSTLAAPAFQLGPTNLAAYPADASQIPPYVIEHMTFTGGAGGAVAVECEKFVSECGFNFNYIKDFGTSAATSWTFSALGGNNEVHVIGNRWWSDDTTTGRNAFQIKDSTNNGSDTVQFTDNTIIGNGNPPNFTGNCAGIGLYLLGNWGDVSDNSFYGFNQQIVVGNTGANSIFGTNISGNAFDTHSCTGPGGGAADIWLGDAGVSQDLKSFTATNNRFTGGASSFLFEITPTATVNLINDFIDGNTIGSGSATPTCSVTGAGTGATCTVFGSDNHFTIGITAGTTAGATGTVTLNYVNIVQIISGTGIGRACSVSNGGTFDVNASFGLSIGGTSNAHVQFNWANNGVSLTNATQYFISGFCFMR